MTLNDVLPAEAAQQDTSTKEVRGVAALSAIMGLGALAASSCCVLPLFLGGIGAGARVFATLEALAPLRLPFLLVSALAVGVGWWLYARRQTACTSGSTCEPPRHHRAALSLLSLASLFVILASLWSFIEPVLLPLLRSA